MGWEKWKNGPCIRTIYICMTTNLMLMFWYLHGIFEGKVNILFIGLLEKQSNLDIKTEGLVTTT